MDIQDYKLELPKRWRIYYIFYIPLLDQDTIKKGQVDEKTAEKVEFKGGNNNEEYKVEGICNSTVYAKESEVGQLLGLYYLVSWKSYLKDESTWEFASAVQHLRKLVSTFYKDCPNKLTATSPPIDLAPAIAKCTASPNFNDKRKRGRTIGSV